MFNVKSGPDGQAMMRATGGPGIPDSPELWHSLAEWENLIAETKATAAVPGHRFERVGVRAFAKLNGGQPPAPALNGGIHAHAPRVHAGDVVAQGEPGDAPTTLSGHDEVWARYNRAGVK